MRKIYFSFFVVLMSLVYVNAQNSEITNSILERKYSPEWELIEQDQFVDIFYKYVDCTENENSCCEWLFFKVVNKSDEAITLNWDFKLGWRADVGGSVTSENTQHVSISLSPKEVLFSDCGKLDPYDIVLTVREMTAPDVNVLTEVSLDNIETTIE